MSRIHLRFPQHWRIMHTITRQEIIRAVEKTGLSEASADFLVATILGNFPLAAFAKHEGESQEMLSSGTCLDFKCLPRKNLVPPIAARSFTKVEVEEAIKAIENLIETRLLGMDPTSKEINVDGMGVIKSKLMIVWTLSPEI